MNCTRRVSCRNAAIEEARNISPSPTPTTSGVWQRAPTSVPSWSRWMATIEKCPSSCCVGLAEGGDEVALVVALDQVRDHLGVGLRRERVPVGDERLLELAVVLDDPVQDDRHRGVVAAGERVRVLERDARRASPSACVRRRSSTSERVRLGLPLQLLEVADGAEVVEPVRLEQREPRGVVAAVLEPLEPLEREAAYRPCGPTYPMIPHTALLLWYRRTDSEISTTGTRKARPSSPPRRRDGQPSSCSHERRDASTELFCLLVRFGLGEHADHGLGARRPHQHAALGRRARAFSAVDLVSHGVTELAARDADVLLGLRVALHHRRGLGERPALRARRRGAARRRARRR